MQIEKLLEYVETKTFTYFLCTVNKQVYKKQNQVQKSKRNKMIHE